MKFFIFISAVCAAIFSGAVGFLKPDVYVQVVDLGVNSAAIATAISFGVMILFSAPKVGLGERAVSSAVRRQTTVDNWQQEEKFKGIAVHLYILVFSVVLAFIFKLTYLFFNINPGCCNFYLKVFSGISAFSLACTLLLTLRLPLLAMNAVKFSNPSS